jgi:hypothetical protein
MHTKSYELRVTSYEFRIISLCLLCVMSLSGCIAYMLGNEVNHPKPGHPGYISRNFTCSYQDCFEHIQNILEEMEISIYYKNKTKGYISARDFTPVFRQCSPATEVGIFLTPTGQFRTEIAIACGNVRLADFAAAQIYSRLEERLLETPPLQP